MALKNDGPKSENTSHFTILEMRKIQKGKNRNDEENSLNQKFFRKIEHILRTPY